MQICQSAKPLFLSTSDWSTQHLISLLKAHISSGFMWNSGIRHMLKQIKVYSLKRTHLFSSFQQQRSVTELSVKFVFLTLLSKFCGDCQSPAERCCVILCVLLWSGYKDSVTLPRSTRTWQIKGWSKSCTFSSTPTLTV